MSELVHLSADADAQTIVDTLTRDGALILDNVVDADFLAASEPRPIRIWKPRAMAVMILPVVRRHVQAGC